MFVRRKPNKSGTFSVQVVEKRCGRNVVVRSFGASKDEEVLSRMESEAHEFISKYGGQQVLDFTERPVVTSTMLFGCITAISQNGPHLVLDRIYDSIGFCALGSELLRDLVISRVCQPMSKLATVDYFRRYRGYDTDVSCLYRLMDRLDEDVRQQVQRISVAHTTGILGGRIGVVFYDVTTLYFESAHDDGFRAQGFSKDGKTAETQIVLGLLVSLDGYPLAYSVFNGSQYEGRTMIPVIDDFVHRFRLTDFVVVADAGLLSRRNIEMLKAAGYSFILGGRIKKESEAVREWVMSLDKDEKKLNETTVNGDDRLIVSYSGKRAAKDARNREKGIQRLRKAFASGRITKESINRRGYNKFLTIDSSVKVSIDQEKIEEDARWNGLKSYVTNTDLLAEEVIRQYHGLWVVERAFRIAKGTLETRPIFHFTPRRIEAHICICFMAYKVYKELERTLKAEKIPMSADRAMDIAKTISTVTVKDSDRNEHSQVMLLTDEQKMLEPLIRPKN